MNSGTLLRVEAPAWWLLCVFLVGCSGSAAQPNQTTGHDEIAAFIEQNPQFNSQQDTNSDDSAIRLGQ